MEAEHEGAGGEADDQRLPHDELRHQAEPHPVMRARDAVLGVGDHEGRQREAADIKRQDRARRRSTATAVFTTPASSSETSGGDDKGHPAAAGEKAAQQRVFAAGAIFRNDLLRRRRDAEIHHAAEQQHPGPDIDIDAVIRAAHPARQQDLREIGQRRADDADDEDRAGEPPGHARLRWSRQRATAASIAAARSAPAGAGCCGLSVHHGHGGNPRAKPQRMRRRSGSINDSLRFGGSRRRSGERRDP